MTVKLNGKDYVTVNERVEAALAAEVSYQMVSADTFSINDRWFYRVTILVGERQYIGTAEIKFNAPSGSADGKNPVECAETSALGRALGFAGYGVVDSIASADEMTRSESRHAPATQPAKPAPAMVNTLKDAPARAEDQQLLDQRLRQEGFRTARMVIDFVREHLDRQIQFMRLASGDSDITMGECSTLLKALNELKMQRETAKGA